MKNAEIKLNTIAVMVGAMHKFVSNLNDNNNSSDELMGERLKAAQESISELKRVAERLGLENQKPLLQHAA